MYSKEVAKVLTRIAVVLPGTSVEVSQIIHFPFGRRGIWPFIKPWSDNVTVFIGLHRFIKNTFGYQPESAISRMLPFETAEVNKMTGELVNSNDDKFSLEPVSAIEILDDQDFNDLT